MGEPNINGNNFWSRLQFNWDTNAFMNNCSSWANTWLTGNIWSGFMGNGMNWFNTGFFGGGNVDYSGLDPLNFAQNYFKFGGGNNFGVSVWNGVGSQIPGMYGVGDSYNFGASRLGYLPGSSGGGKSETPEQKQLRESFNLMRAHLTKLQDKLDATKDDEKKLANKIESVLKNSTVNQANYDKLKDVYTSEAVKNKIAENPSDIYVNIKEELAKTGYYLESDELNNAVGELEEYITSLKPDNEPAEFSDFKLAVLSRFQESEGKSIIKYISEEITKKPGKKAVLEKVVVEFAGKLMEEVQGDLEKNDDIVAAKNELESLISGNIDLEKLEKAFNELYTLIRMEKAKALLAACDEKYGEHIKDIEILGDVMAVTKDRLKTEGMDVDLITEISAQDYKPAKRQLTKLHEEDVLGKLNKTQQESLRKILANVDNYDLGYAYIGRRGNEKDVVIIYNKKRDKIQKLNIKLDENGEFKTSGVIIDIAANKLKENNKDAVTVERQQAVGKVIDEKTSEQISAKVYDSIPFSKKYVASQVSPAGGSVGTYADVKRLSLSYNVTNGEVSLDESNEKVYNDCFNQIFDALEIEKKDKKGFEKLFRLAWISTLAYDEYKNKSILENGAIKEFLENVMDKFCTLTKNNANVERIPEMFVPDTEGIEGIDQGLRRIHNCEVAIEDGYVSLDNIKNEKYKSAAESAVNNLYKQVRQKYPNDNELDEKFKTAVTDAGKQFPRGGRQTMKWFLDAVVKNFNELMYKNTYVELSSV